MKQYAFRVRVTRAEEWIVEADSAEEARSKIESGDIVDECHLDLIDWEVLGVSWEA